jgi:hypothetical protein
MMVKTPNPAHENWVAVDQQVLGFLLSSVTREVLQQVSTCKTAAAVWSNIEHSFGSLTQVRAVNTRLALAMTQKGNMSVIEYVNKLHALSDEMASVRKALDDEDMVSYILAGLDIEFNLVVSAAVARVEPISVNELFGQLLSFESRQVLLQGFTPPPSSNAAMRGRGGFNRGRGGGRGRFRGCNNNNAPGPTTPTIALPIMVRDMCIRCVRRKATLLYSVGIAMMKAMDKRRERRLLLPMHMEWTRIGTPTRGQHITLQGN